MDEGGHREGQPLWDHKAGLDPAPEEGDLELATGKRASARIVVGGIGVEGVGADRQPDQAQQQRTEE